MTFPAGKIAQRYRDLQFRWKVALVCLVAGLLPMLLLGNFCYGQIRSLLHSREEQALGETVGQAAASLGRRLDACRSAMALGAWDKNLGQALEKVYRSNYEMYEAYQYLVDPLFLVSRTINRDIRSGTLYTSANLYPHGDTVRPMEEARGLLWYEQMSREQTPLLFVGAGGELELVSPVYSAGGGEHYISMQLDYAGLFSPLESLFEGDYGVLLLDKEGREVYSHRSCDTLPDGSQALGRLADGTFGRDYLSAQEAVGPADWTMLLYRPLRAVYGNTQRITLAVLLVAAGCALLLYALTHLLSQAVVRPLEDLTRNMRGIEDGDLSLSLPPGPPRADEVGLLVGQFSSMVRRLQYLIGEVYESRIARQEYEMKALQAQINPHFFYNSLSLINSKAIMAGQNDISRMAQLLSAFYRTTLNRGESAITVADEWTNTVSYVRIQLMMHRDSFDFTEDLDPAARAFVMPNLLLQPLAENAIVHGIDHREASGRGSLTITGRLHGGTLEFTVRDNGCGIAPERLSTLLTQDHPGYGVHNVHRRVRLYCGEGYGLSFESAPGAGTAATLRLPARGALDAPSGGETTEAERPQT